MGHSLSLALIKCEDYPSSGNERQGRHVMVHGPTWSTAMFGKVSIVASHMHKRTGGAVLLHIKCVCTVYVCTRGVWVTLHGTWVYTRKGYTLSCRK